MIQNIFKDFFNSYIEYSKKEYLTYKISRGGLDRPGNPRFSSHAIPGNALDFSLRKNNSFAVIDEYNKLFEYIMQNWKYRAGIDNEGINIHIHVDLAGTIADKSRLPLFFKENNGVMIYTINEISDIYRGL